MKSYKYVGPEDLLELTKTVSKGYKLSCPEDVLTWINDTDQFLDEESRVVATYIVNLSGEMLIADRHSEHVACAGGENVLSAGEILFEIVGGKVEVFEVTNQSTGYCPESDSWSEVEKLLRNAMLNSPEDFERKFLFRKCENCGAINIVKEDWFVCMECDSDLPLKWNMS